MKTEMKIVAITSDKTMCDGLRLAGVDSHYVTTDEAAATVLAQIDDTTVVAVSEEFADLAQQLTEQHPHILVTTIPS